MAVSYVRRLHVLPQPATELKVTRADPVEVVVLEENQLRSQGLCAMLATVPLTVVVPFETIASAASDPDSTVGARVVIASTRTERGMLRRLAELSFKLLVVVRDDDPADWTAAAKLDADGLILESDVTPPRLAWAIDAVASGQVPMSPACARALLRRSDSSPIAALTTREQDVLRLMTSGLSNKQIATTLRLSIHTSRRYVANVLAKLGCDNRTAAATRALREGLVSTDADSPGGIGSTDGRQT